MWTIFVVFSHIWKFALEKLFSSWRSILSILFYILKKPWEHWCNIVKCTYAFSTMTFTRNLLRLVFTKFIVKSGPTEWHPMRNMSCLLLFYRRFYIFHICLSRRNWRKYWKPVTVAKAGVAVDTFLTDGHNFWADKFISSSEIVKDVWMCKFNV